MQGSTLIVLGDVSGKGLQAAMTVSLIVGAVRTLAKFAPQPTQMLAEVNQRLHGRLQGGFATCIAVLLNPDGSCILASAGHPAPFLNQRELELPGALPLGLDLGATYQQVRVQLREGDHFPSIPMACWKRATSPESFTALKPPKKRSRSGRRKTSRC